MTERDPHRTSPTVDAIRNYYQAGGVHPRFQLDWRWRRVGAGHYVAGTGLSARVYRIDRHAGGWSVHVCDATAWAEKPGNPAAVECIGDEYRTLDDAKAAAEKFERS
jgi:hypothetical protein